MLLIFELFVREEFLIRVLVDYGLILLYWMLMRFGLFVLRIRVWYIFCGFIVVVLSVVIW